MSERMLIIGAGAVGAYAGGYLARDGRDVTLCDPWPDHVETMRRDGLRLEGVTAEECFDTAVKAIHLTDLQATRRDGPFDIVFICVKSYDTPWAAALAREYLAPNGFAVSLQNGINEDAIAEIVGWGRTVGVIASKIVVDLVEPGRVCRRVAKGGAKHTVFRIGEPHGRITPRLERLNEMLASIDAAKVTSNLWGERWSKLVANSMSNGVSAATGLSVTEYTKAEATRRLSIRLAGEAVRVGQANGYALEKINGFAPENWVAAAAELTGGANDTPVLDKVEDGMLSALANLRDDARPSMGQDIRKGRRTEIDYLNGLVVRRGAEVGIDAPANARLVDAVSAVENGALPPAPERVEGF